MEKEFKTLSEKLENHCRRCGIKVVREKDIKEFIRIIKIDLMMSDKQKVRLDIIAGDKLTK